MKGSNTNRQTAIFALTATLGFVLLANSLVAAQDKQFKAGDRVLASPTFMDDEKYWYKCTYVKFDNSTNSPYVVECDGREYHVQSRYIRLLNETEIRNDSARKNQTNANNQNQVADENQTAEGGSCTSDAALMAKPKAGDSMELTFKRTLLKGYQAEVEQKNSLTAPLGVGISFESFQIGQPRINRRTLNRTDGTYIREAPVGGKLYPVKTKFTVCKQYNGEIQRSLVDGRYECFKDTFGEWMCGNASGWRILETKRELLR